MRYIFILIGLSLLTACSGTKDKLGLNRQAPDEFAVIKQAPLALPPDYTLRPPQPGAPRPQEQETAKQAAIAVFGAPDKDATAPLPTDLGETQGENALLQSAGASHIDPNIRKKVDYETSARVDENKPVIDKILDLASDKNDVPAEVLDAVKESKRLKENMKEGKPMTEGETPSLGD